ncbi:MAG: hypothetical protein JWO67_4260 [Streptosporangiaceae bacterium]|nr:hypothetical protein [Streptosporangiaceae bacterium]
MIRRRRCDDWVGAVRFAGTGAASTGTKRGRCRRVEVHGSLRAAMFAGTK